MLQKKIRYKNLNPYRGNNGIYTATNESVVTFNHLLGDITVNRAAGICSGGEIGLFVLLPRIKKQLTLIDHNYESMSFAMIKVLLIQELGGKRAHEYITKKENVKKLDSVIKKLPGLPDEFKRRETNSHYYVYDHFVTPHGVNRNIYDAWQKLKAEDVIAIENKLHLVEFLHGDLTDLGKKTKYDLLYLSNALEYGGREGRVDAKALVSACVKPGGLVVNTYAPGNPEARSTAFTALKKVEEQVACGSLRWAHCLHKVPATS